MSEDPQVTALRDLEEASRRPLFIRFGEGGIPRFVGLDLPFSAPTDPVARALDYLERYRDLYLLEDPGSQLHLRRILRRETKAGESLHLFFGQHRDGIAVFAAATSTTRPRGTPTATGLEMPVTTTTMTTA